MPYPLIWPAALKPETESWNLEQADRTGGMSLSGIEQVVDSASSRWRAKIGFRLYRSQILAARAIVAGLRGRSGTLIIGPADLIGAPANDQVEPWELGVTVNALSLANTYRTGTVTAMLAAAASLRATRLDVVMLPRRTPVVGNYLGIDDRLHVVTSIAALSGGAFECQIEPGLRSDLPAGAAIRFHNPACTMRMASPPADLMVSGSDFITPLTLDLVEAL